MDIFQIIGQSIVAAVLGIFTVVAIALSIFLVWVLIQTMRGK